MAPKLSTVRTMIAIQGMPPQERLRLMQAMEGWGDILEGYVVIPQAVLDCALDVLKLTLATLTKVSRKSSDLAKEVASASEKLAAYGKGPKANEIRAKYRNEYIKDRLAGGMPRKKIYQHIVDNAPELLRLRKGKLLRKGKPVSAEERNRIAEDSMWKLYDRSAE
jgi:hypothetical protein